MAQFFPSLEQIKRLKVKPEQGELHLLEFLESHLNDSYEVYFQPFLNGDNPDIILMRENSGVMIIEVKDWRLDNYYVDDEGNWRLKLNGVVVKSPLAQVDSYKDNLYYLHIDQLLEKKISSPDFLAIVTCVVYFHNEPEHFAIEFCKNDQHSTRHIRLLGHDSLSKQVFTNLLYDTYLARTSWLFDEGLYNSFKRYLQPTVHTVSQGRQIKYSKNQERLTISDVKPQKVLGVAGSGKTMVLAKRAVNAHLRTGGKVLILAFNITLRNYIHDRVSEVRAEFAWRNFHIIHYHLFFVMEANNHNLQITSLADFDDTEFFESVKDSIRKYDAILIDEIQDYQPAWIEIIRKYFLVDGGEFVVFGDEKQNIYHRPLDKDKRPKTGIPGAWNKLNESHRYTTKIIGLATRFQRHFFLDKYELDEIELIEQPKPSLFDVQEIISYVLFDKGTTPECIGERIISKIKRLNAHPNDVAILSSTVEFLRELDFYIRNNLHEKTTTTFETKEMLEQVNKIEIEKIRKSMKFKFWANSGTMKISTIHSFKGWEVQTLFLILEDGKDASDEGTVTEELIYAGITRCRGNLVVINIGNQKYHEFFASEFSAQHDVEPTPTLVL